MSSSCTRRTPSIRCRAVLCLQSSPFSFLFCRLCKVPRFSFRARLPRSLLPSQACNIGHGVLGIATPLRFLMCPASHSQPAGSINAVGFIARLAPWDSGVSPGVSQTRLLASGFPTPLQPCRFYEVGVHICTTQIWWRYKGCGK